MKLRKVISGGQTGADRTALECAKARGLETGGTAPKGYRTETGPDLSLKDFGLVEHESAEYPPRTYQNVDDADVTVWFGGWNSPGYRCTRSATDDLNKVFVANPSPQKMRELAEKYEVWNVAGNRASKNPGVADVVRRAFDAILPIRPTTPA